MTDATQDIPDLSRLKIERKQKRSRRGGPNWMAIFIVGAALAGGFWWWQTQSGPKADPNVAEQLGPRIVRAEIWQANSSSSISANGYVIARRRAALSTVLSGRLVEINVEEGSEVQEGEVVARIQFDDYENSLAEAERNVETARARLEQNQKTVDWQRVRVEQAKSNVMFAKVSLEGTKTDLAEAERDSARNKPSFEKGVIHEADWDRIKTQVLRLRDQIKLQEAQISRDQSAVDAARAELATSEIGIQIAEREIAAAEASRQSAALLLEKTFVRSPFAGVIVDKGAEEGEVVAATGAGGNSRGSVATVVDLKTLEIQVELPETRLGQIANGQRVEIFLDVEPGRAWPGEVRQIWPKADRGKGTVEIRATFRERPEVLRPEMGARVVFMPEAQANEDLRLVSLPSTAIKKDGDQSWVFLLEAGKLTRRDIEIHERTGQKTLVKVGLSAGDQIIDRPGRDLHVGDRFSD